jgi:hypothetical protein
VWLLLAISLVTIWTANFSQAADYTLYIDGTGDDDLGTGTLGAPWRTILRAFSEIPALNMTTADNLVIYVGPGTYSVGNGESDSASAYMISTPNIAIKGVGSSSSINGSGAAGWTSGFTIAADNITITELQFMGFSGTGVTISGGDNVKVLGCEFLNNGNGIALYGSSTDLSSEFAGNIIDGSANSGIMVEGGTSGTVSPMIKGNTISGSGSSGISLFVMSSTSSVASRIYGNSIKYSNTYGIHMNAQMGTLSPFVSSNRISANPTGIYINSYSGSVFPVIRNNLINEYHPSNADFAINIALPMSGSVTPEIIHNTLDGAGQTATGINIPNSVNVIPEIRYNIITNFSSYGIYNSQAGAVEIDYNNVYGNTQANYYNFDPTGTDNISADPLYEYDFSIPANSPCVDVIPVADEVSNLTVPVADDLIGTSRPRASAAGQDRNYDMGCFEYPYQEYTFTMPGGVGLPRDYRLMTNPLSDKSGGSLFSEFESAFGTYDPKIWRIFAYRHGTDPAEYMEINEANFGEYFSSFQGSAFWVISRSGSIGKEYHTFDGNNSANKRPYSIGLSQGWNLISLPWADSGVNPNIMLDNVVVQGMDSKYYLLDLENDLTQQAVWSYGATGYQELNNPSDALVIGQGYWIYSSSYGVSLIIPPDNSGDYFTLGKYSKSGKGAVKRSVKGLTPPQPPGTSLTAEGGNGCFVDSVL